MLSELRLSLGEKQIRRDAVSAYAPIVHEGAVGRALKDTCDNFAGYLERGEMPNELVDELGGLVQQIQKRATAPVQHDDLGESVERVISEARSGVPQGVKCRINAVNRALGGSIQPGLIVLGARPSMGKTSLALNVSVDFALQHLPVAFFSYETVTDKISQRLLQAETGISFNGSDDDPYDFQVWNPLQHHDQVRATGRRLATLPLRVFNLARDPSVGMLERQARRMKADGGLSLIVADYLQLMKPPRETDSENVNLTQIVDRLKLLAIDLNIPIILLSQLNRKVEERTDKRPMMSDLRGSGSIEQAADVIGFLFRAEYYLEREKKPVPRDVLGMAEFIIAKNKDGRCGTADLSYCPPITKFDDPAKNRAIPPEGDGDDEDERPKPRRRRTPAQRSWTDADEDDDA